MLTKTGWKIIGGILFAFLLTFAVVGMCASSNGLTIGQQIVKWCGGVIEFSSKTRGIL